MSVEEELIRNTEIVVVPAPHGPERLEYIPSPSLGACLQWSSKASATATPRSSRSTSSSIASESYARR